ncbi:hypothetical protein GCM10010923_20430 [Blastomonas marina]|uniref:Uncharacterized protein n=1 Tax=Blastomonas marina TaxID=1867408 RepID=A0ABQ1FFF1_9SPHN|nr:hypothetical protein GCM10010923_20430 [Blastomonas marina]
MMGGGDVRDALASRPSRERLVARLAGAFRNIALADLDHERIVRNAKLAAILCNEPGFGSAFCAQAVVDRRRAHCSRKGLRREQQEREAIGSARDGDAQPPRRAVGQRADAVLEPEP